MSRRKQGVERPPQRLYSLSGMQEHWLKQARASAHGAYVGMTSGPHPDELVDGGAAEYYTITTNQYREAWAGHWEAGYYDRADIYLIPTTHGLALLAESEKRAAAERERKDREWRRRYP